MIDLQVGHDLNLNSKVKPPKVPEPQAYHSDEDAEEFEGWLTSILRWFRVNQYCGPELYEDHIVCVALFLCSPVLMCITTTWMA